MMNPVCRSVRRTCLLAAWIILTFPSALFGAEKFSVATYNLENYIDAPAGTRPAKSAEARAKIRESIHALRPDILGLEEMGGTNSLFELRASLKTEGLDYLYWEHVSGFDTNIHVAVLSKFPIIARRPHTNDGFLLNGRRFRVSRGFVEVDIQVNSHYTFTLFVAHLKSRRPVPEADEADLREQEALILREKIDARFRANPNANIAVIGDFNDVKDSKSTRVLIGKGKQSLIDTRPAERNGDSATNAGPRYAPRHITWTYFYGKEDTYSRIDYILVSHGMVREWDSTGTYITTIPNWGIASDHRPIVAGFVAQDK